MTTNNLALLVTLGAIIVLLTTTAINMLVSELQTRRMSARVEQALATGPVARTPLAGLISSLNWLGAWSRSLYTSANLDNLRGAIQAAGFNPHKTLPILLGVKLTFTVVIVVIGVLGAATIQLYQLRLASLGVGIIVGILGPEWILAFLRSRFRSALNRGTPDALDLLVVCSEAGMGLESALGRVALDMRNSNTALASVLSNLLDDLRVLPNRRDAFMNLGVKSGSDALRRFGTMLSQSLHYGTPLNNALRAVADELRRDRMNKLEEKAVKLPAKLIFPLIGFIMPSLYIVLLGPSFLRIYDTLLSIGH
jgi:tight adherence protein C